VWRSLSSSSLSSEGCNKEHENEDNPQSLNDDEIVAQVHYEKVLKQGEIIKVESAEEEEDDVL
jgi:hypothetical protein